MDLYWNDKKTAYGVLYSPGYGAGWSSWNDKALAYDKRVIDYWMTHKHAKIKEVSKYLKELGYDAYVSVSNWYNLELEWMRPLVYWRINEYDGSESIEILNLDNWNHF